MPTSHARFLPLALVLCACGGGAPASVPLQLVLPIGPEGASAPGHCTKSHATFAPSTPAAPAAPAAFEPMRPAAAPVTVTPAARAIADAADRDPEQKKLDGGRHPAELLSFLALKPGERVAEIAAGTGYTTELLARDVGPRGKVWAQNNAFVLKLGDGALAKLWAAELAKPVMKNVVRADKEVDAPFPPEAKNLDAVVNVLFYHDTVRMGAERDKMNRAVFDALRRGGQYVIVDHSAREGSGTADVKTLHRIDELYVIREIEHAGFHLAATADFLRNPNDTREWNASPRDAGERRGTSDRFVLKFIKP